MPAQSQQQQKLFGLALSVKRGETPRSEASDEVLNIVNSMSEKEIEDFAGTEHSGLPKKVESQLRGVVREIMRERVLSEAAGKEAMGIAAFTGTRGDAVQKFIDDNKLDAKKLFNYVKGGKLTDRLNFVTAIVGTPGNSVQKKMIKMFGESVNEEKYPIAVEKFNKELIKHPMVKKAADFYKKTPAEIVKVLQQRLYTKGDKTGNTKEVYIDFKDTTSGITIKHKMKFNESVESVNEASYNFGKEEYTKKNMTPTQILDLAMAYANISGKGTNMYGGKMENMIKVANDLARLNGTKQMDAKARGSQPALLLFLLKNQLVTKDEYVKLYKNLLEKQISVVKALKNADPASRMIGGAAARQAHRDMKGEFDTE